MLTRKRKKEILQNDDLKQKNQLSGLTWKMLMDRYNITVDGLYKLYLNGFYDTFREDSREFLKDKTFNRKNIIKFLYEVKFFKYTKADEIVRLDSIEELDNFIRKYNNIMKFNGNTPEWFLVRGYTAEEADMAMREIKIQGIEPESCDINDSGFHFLFRNLREPENIIKGTMNNEKNEKIKKEVSRIIKEYFNEISGSFFSDYIKMKIGMDKLLETEDYIIKLNDSYNDYDFVRYSLYTEEQYLSEIDKAINFFDVEGGKSYILIWLDDFNDTGEVVNFILECTRSKNLIFSKSNRFFSNRQLDLDYFEKRKNDIEKLKSQDNKFLDIADDFAQKSKCVSKKVCTLIVKNGRIISTGLNGTASGDYNCCDLFDEKNFDRDEHHKFSELKEMHGEMSAILHAAKHGISIDGCTVYSNLEPCMQCLKNLYVGGITRVVYRHPYDYNDNEDYKCFKNEMIANGMEIIHRGT